MYFLLTLYFIQFIIFNLFMRLSKDTINLNKGGSYYESVNSEESHKKSIVTFKGNYFDKFFASISFNLFLWDFDFKFYFLFNKDTWFD